MSDESENEMVAQLMKFKIRAYKIVAIEKRNADSTLIFNLES